MFKKVKCLICHWEKCLCHSTLTYAERKKNYEDDFFFFLALLIYENLLAGELYRRITSKNNCEKSPWLVMFVYDCHITEDLQAVFLHTLLRLLESITSLYL